MAQRIRRKNYFIDKNFQSAFIVKFCSVVLVSSIVIAGLILFMTQDSTTVAIYNTKVQVQQTADFIKPIVMTVIITVTVLASLGIMTLTLFISHRIAGPKYRLKREVDALAKGSLKVGFFLRAKDELKDLSRSLHYLTEVIKDNHNKQVIQIDLLKKYLEEKDYALSKKDKDKLVEIIENLDREIHFFKK